MTVELRSGDELARLGEGLKTHPVISPLLSYSPTFVGVLNDARQFVLANEKVISRYSRVSLEDIAGSLPHDIFDCAVDLGHEYVCGQTEHCAACDLNKILQGVIRTQERYEGTARLLGNTSSGVIETYVFQVAAHRLNIDGKVLILLFMQNQTSFEARNHMMRLFFHDLLNTLSSMGSLMQLLQPVFQENEESSELSQLLHRSYTDVMEQIHYYRKLTLEDPGTDRSGFHQFDLGAEIDNLVKSLTVYLRQNALDIRLEAVLSRVEINSDKPLVRRIILNMLKNAVEACDAGAVVSVVLSRTENGVAVSVANPGDIPPDIREKIFQRGFSSKGHGRGLGTYSMKLLSTTFLGGDVSFQTGGGKGTVFTLTLPA